MAGVAIRFRGDQVRRVELLVGIHPHQGNSLVLLRRDLRFMGCAGRHLLRDLILLEHQTHESPQLGGIDDGQHKVENLETRVIQQRGILPNGNGTTRMLYAFSNFSFWLSLYRTTISSAAHKNTAAWITLQLDSYANSY